MAARILATLLLVILGATDTPTVVSGLLVPSARAAGRPLGPLHQTSTAKSQQTPPQKKNPLLKLAEPWPDAEQLRQRKAEAEARPLFGSDDPIAITLAANFKIINKDRDPNSQRRYPADLSLARGDGGMRAISVSLSARGHVRRMARTCDFVPLRVELPREGLEDTLLAGQSTLKLVVQCSKGGEYQQYLLREYLAYRIFNLLTPRSVRARLAKITYIDSTSGRSIGTRYGMFIEHEGDLAKRMEGRLVELPRILFKDVNAETLETMMVFEYMIGNTDLSLYAPHNVILVQTPNRTLYPVPYDFDLSGLVHPPYAIPARGLPIKTVQDRLYRGPCQALEQVEPILAGFTAKKDLVMNLADAIVDMDKSSRQDAKDFLGGFYSSIRNQKDVKRLFVEGCSKAPTI